MKIYISGAITGHDDYMETFARVQKHLSDQWDEVINPTTLEHDHDESYENYMKEDIKALLECDAIFMIWGWKESRGAKFERSVAEMCGLGIMYGGKI